MAKAVLVFTHIPKYKYILVDSILCVVMFVHTPYAQICAISTVDNRGPKKFV